jgi:phospholipase/carboxylesterase
MIHNPENFLTAGEPLNRAQHVLFLVHGRGGSAQNMLALTQHLTAPGVAFVAPQATGHTWYPQSFMMPREQNEPHLSAALLVLAGLRARIQSDFNLPPDRMFWLGFSQGACLTLEFVTRNPQTYGGVFGLSGGLIGPDEALTGYDGSLTGTPVLLGCSDTDPHIPKQRVLDTAAVLEKMGAVVTTRLYANFGHSVNEDELAFVNEVLNGAVAVD